MNILKYWTPDDFEISSDRYTQKNKINKQLNKSGGDETGKCIYTYNELGFRGDSFNKTGFKIMSIGDSCTDGIGVNDNQTWPYYHSLFRYRYEFCHIIFHN